MAYLNGYGLILVLNPQMSQYFIGAQNFANTERAGQLWTTMMRRVSVVHVADTAQQVLLHMLAKWLQDLETFAPYVFLIEIRARGTWCALCCSPQRPFTHSEHGIDIGSDQPRPRSSLVKRARELCRLLGELSPVGRITRRKCAQAVGRGQLLRDHIEYIRLPVGIQHRKAQ